MIRVRYRFGVWKFLKRVENMASQTTVLTGKLRLVIMDL